MPRSRRHSSSLTDRGAGHGRRSSGAQAAWHEAKAAAELQTRFTESIRLHLGAVAELVRRQVRLPAMLSVARPGEGVVVEPGDYQEVKLAYQRRLDTLPQRVRLDLDELGAGASVATLQAVIGVHAIDLIVPSENHLLDVLDVLAEHASTLVALTLTCQQFSMLRQVITCLVDAKAVHLQVLRILMSDDSPSRTALRGTLNNRVLSVYEEQEMQHWAAVADMLATGLPKLAVLAVEPDTHPVAATLLVPPLVRILRATESQLFSLSLNLGFAPSPVAARLVRDGLASARNLRALHLSSTADIAPVLFQSGINKLLQLERLSLHRCVVKHDTLVVLAEWLSSEKPARLQALDLRFSRVPLFKDELAVLRATANLRLTDLSINWTLSDDVIALLAQHPHMRRVQLITSGLRFDHGTSGRLVRVALPQWTHLRQLDGAVLKLSPDAAPGFTDCVAMVAPHLTHLSLPKDMPMSELMRVLTTALPNAQQMIVLSFRGCQMDDPACLALIECLPGMQALRQLDLAYNKFGSRALQTLCQTLCMLPVLRVLVFASVDVERLVFPWRVTTAPYMIRTPGVRATRLMYQHPAAASSDLHLLGAPSLFELAASVVLSRDIHVPDTAPPTLRPLALKARLYQCATMASATNPHHVCLSWRSQHGILCIARVRVYTTVLFVETLLCSQCRLHSLPTAQASHGFSFHTNI